MTKKEYISKCRERWYGEALRDAVWNWEDWEGWREYLTEAMRQFLRDPFMTDLGGKRHNPTGYLTEFLWRCQSAVQKNKYSLNPFLDFEEHYQKVFLRRGLIIYCRGLLDEMKNIDRSEPLFAAQEDMSVSADIQ